jgi:ferredoxin
MALLITDACINCGACEAECPNTAIYEGGEKWLLNGKANTALIDEYFYIAPDKCTECVGFHNEPQCIAVCPVDCIIIDPDHVETKEELLTKKEQLHLIER